jgi:hypothetical protein
MQSVMDVFLAKTIERPFIKGKIHEGSASVFARLLSESPPFDPVAGALLPGPLPPPRPRLRP